MEGHRLQNVFVDLYEKGGEQSKQIVLCIYFYLIRNKVQMASVEDKPI